MATPKTVISEIFYHKTSALRFELGSYKDVTKFKIEVVPQAKDPAGQPIEKKFNYDGKLSMVFGLGEILRLKRFVENALNPQKQVPADGYIIEHFFDAGTPPEKKKSALIFKRVENLSKKNEKIWNQDPYQFAFSVSVTMYSSLVGTSISFILSSEEAYWIMNTMPTFAWAYMQENARINEENRAAKAAGGAGAAAPAARSPYRAPAAGAEAGVDQGAPAGVSDSSKPAFEDVPFGDDIPF